MGGWVGGDEQDVKDAKSFSVEKEPLPHMFTFIFDLPLPARSAACLLISAKVQRLFTWKVHLHQWLFNLFQKKLHFFFDDFEFAKDTRAGKEKLAAKKWRRNSKR